MKLNQEITYLTGRLERTIESEKRIEEDLLRVEESATPSHISLGWVLSELIKRPRRVTR